MITNKSINPIKLHNNIFLKKKNYKSFFLSISTVNENRIVFYDGAMRFLYPTTSSFIRRLLLFNNFLCSGYFIVNFSEKYFIKLISYLNIFNKNNNLYKINKCEYNKNMKKLKANVVSYENKTNINLFVFSNKIKYNLLVNLLVKTAIGINLGWLININFININFKIYVDVKEGLLTFFVGKSHGSLLYYDSSFIVVILKKKKKILKLLSFNKALLGDLARDIKKLRPISKYKNKGIKYDFEIIKFKQGKTKQR